MPEFDHCFIAIDFETADPKRDSACAVGLVRVERGQIVARRTALIRPPRSLFTTTFIHGITWRQVAREPTFGELWPQLRPMFDGVTFIAAHNASFERSVLFTCCTAAGLEPPAARFQCTVELVRQRWGLHPAKLPHVCAHFGFELNHHDAGSDAEACARIVMRAAEEDRAARRGAGA